MSRAEVRAAVAKGLQEDLKVMRQNRVGQEDTGPEERLRILGVLERMDEGTVNVAVKAFIVGLLVGWTLSLVGCLLGVSLR